MVGVLKEATKWRKQMTYIVIDTATGLPDWPVFATPEEAHRWTRGLNDEEGYERFTWAHRRSAIGRKALRTARALREARE